ncbi:hypothetical protein F5Y19DRAFT_484522 [Xylariaceae sp. FL1651]|nr:hypothetical protein F5Y19DRAFT_484522 [Xylariaceae sp. FL1651]
MLPQPSLRFTLPSIHDDTKLDCRVYHPQCLRNLSPAGTPWSRQAAIVAHPYAPLGGCFDDPVVNVVAGTLLELGFLVTTFNFRGAASSEGHTSWTSKPEQADYISVVGFTAYYVHHLHPPPSVCPVDRRQSPILLLAGYSYGAMVTTRLPPLDTVMSCFATPPINTAEADIRLRAQHFAEEQNALFAAPASPRRSLGVRVGGNEDVSRRSHDRNTMVEFEREERIRQSVRELLMRAKLVYQGYSQWPHDGDRDEKKGHCLEKVEGPIAFQSAYLIVSPPVGLVTKLATMSFTNSLSSFWLRRSGAGGQSTTDALIANPTLIIYGDQDGFITQRKIREWTRRLSGAVTSQCRYVEVPGAGHFWTERNVIRKRKSHQEPVIYMLAPLSEYQFCPLLW